MEKNSIAFRFPTVQLALILAFASVPGPFHVGAQSSSSEVQVLIERQQSTYVAEAEILKQQALAADAHWLRQYREAVARFARESQAQGEFEAWQAGTREVERFDRTRSISEADVVAAPEALRILQQRAVEARVEVHRKVARDTVDLTERLVARLDTIKRDQTIRGDATGARTAIDAMTRVRAHDIYTEALLSLDAQEPLPAPASLTPPDPAAEDPDPSQIPPADPGPKTDAPRPPSRLELPTSPGVRISPPDLAPPRATGTRLCILTPTEAHNPGTTPVSLSARYLERDNVRLRLDHQDYLTNTMDVLVAIRAAQDVQRVNGITIVVEYFAGRSSGAAFPVQYTAVNLAAVDTRTLYIQMPPTSYQLQWVPSALGGHRRSLDRTLQSRGFIFTVFDSNGSILFQNASDRALIPLAGDASRYNPDGTLNFR